MDAAVADMADAGTEARGAVFTRREVVDFILDLAGYTANTSLHRMRLLEPSMGVGDFLTPAIDRLLKSYRREVGENGDIVADLHNCIVAVELHRSSYEETRSLVIEAFRKEGLSSMEARVLCGHWLRQGDFLLLPLGRDFTHVIGNPPYVRQELIPDVLMAEYRRRFSTIYDRADIYVPFIERSLSLLAPGGNLGFICADRWIKNRYGGPLRRLVAENFHLKYFVDMVGTAAFLSDLIAYPAIIVISRQKAGPTRIASRPAIDDNTLRELAKALMMPRLGKSGVVTEVARAAEGAEPWMLEAPDQLSVVRRIEAEFPTLEEAGCKVGIGVAEEAFGTAVDLWTAFREGAFGEAPRPFVGWLMLVEDAPESRSPVRDTSPHFPLMPDFKCASYLERYNILCRKLAQERLYTTATIMASPRTAATTGEFSDLSELTGLKTFVTSFAGHIAAAAAR